LELERLQKEVEVFYESWMETQKLLSPEELTERIQGQDLSIVVVEADFVFDEVFKKADKLRFLGVCRGNAGNVDVDAATEHRVLVVNTPGRNAVSVAELTVGLMLSLARQIPSANSLVHSSNWLDPVGPYISMRGAELAGKVVGIVGLGAIGYEVARRLSAFDMNILAYDPYIAPERVMQAGARRVELDELMQESDFITIHCSASPETTGLIDEHKIDLMKPTAFLINTARWEVVAADAIINALKHKRIAGAAFDVHETHPIPHKSPLLELDNVILTPHIGGATDGTVARHSRMIVEDIERFLDGKRPVNLVNTEVWKQNDR
jgi:D-3-phosphoglycerate dehydrogenase